MRSKRRGSVGACAGLVAGLLLAAMGCSDDPAISAVGIWILQTVDANALPAVISDDGTTVVRIERGVLVVQLSGNCLFDATYETTDPSGTSSEQVAAGCEWEQSGSSLAVVIGGSSQAFGTVSETELVYTLDGLEYAFERN